MFCCRLYSHDARDRIHVMGDGSIQSTVINKMVILCLIVFILLSIASISLIADLD